MAGAIVRYPAHRLALFHTSQFDDAAVLAQGVTDTLVAVSVLHLDAAGIGGNADVVGDKDDKRVGVGVLTVFLDGGQLLFVRSAAEKIFHATHEKHLKRRHEGGRTGAVENLRQVRLAEIEFEEAEFPQFGWNQMLEDRIAKALAKKRLVTDKHVGRTQLARLKFTDKAFGLGEGTH